MSMNDVQIPEVPAQTMHARFFRQGNSDMVEISFSGSIDTVVKGVEPEDMATYRSEWLAYCDGKPPTRRQGTPLLDVPGINADRERHLVHMQVHTAEELAALSDMQCQQVGHGTMTERKAARQLLEMKRAEKTQVFQKKMEHAMREAQPVKDDVSTGELSDIKAGIAEMNKNMAALIQALAPKQRGRPKKVIE
jgi:hypothetical protein